MIDGERESCCRSSRSDREKRHRKVVGPKQETIKAKKAKPIGA